MKAGGKACGEGWIKVETMVLRLLDRLLLCRPVAVKLSLELRHSDKGRVIKSVSLSGLLMLVGMVMYISVFKAEVGSKLRPRSSFQVSRM